MSILEIIQNTGFAVAPILITLGLLCAKNALRRYRNI